MKVEETINSEIKRLIENKMIKEANITDDYFRCEKCVMFQECNKILPCNKKNLSCMGRINKRASIFYKKVK